MIPCSDASNPISANSASSRREAVRRNRAEAVEQRFVADIRSDGRGLRPGHRRVQEEDHHAKKASVMSPTMPALGMSFAGLFVSSAANGSSSMPRKNHIAKGSENRMPTAPNGRKVDLPGAGLDVEHPGEIDRTVRQCERSAKQQDHRHRDDRHDQGEAEADRGAKGVEADEQGVEHHPPHPGEPVTREAEPAEVGDDRIQVCRPRTARSTAVVTTYSIVSASPVMKPPHGPIAARAKEYAPPVCGSAAAISPIEKIIVKYMTMMISVAIAIPPNPAVPMPEIPARELAGDHGGDAETPDSPEAGAALQGAFLEVSSFRRPCI